MLNSKKEFLYHIAASYPIIWVDTFEYERSMKTLVQEIKKSIDSDCYFWNIVQGITDIKNVTTGDNDESPLDPINFLAGKDTENNIIFVQDFHMYINDITVWRTLLNSLNDFKQKNNIFVVVSPVVKIPPEIERYVTILNFDLPTREELRIKLEEFATSLEITLDESQIEQILGVGVGLSEFEFENAIAYSISKNGTILPDVIHSQKEQLVKKTSSLEIGRSEGGFELIAGLENLKQFSKKIISSKNGRGALLLGVPGGGKSAFAKSLGYETNRMTINLNFGQLMGSLVGETERKTKEALRIIDSMAPCILFIDEIEKGLSGMSGHNGDSGTSRRQGGEFLQWLNDHESDVYVIATANDISQLPPEFVRAERWDAIFFVDFPNSKERLAILDMYKTMYKITENTDKLDLTNWTGAEIKTLCRIASSLELSIDDATAYVTHIHKTDTKKIDGLKEWAKDRTIPASIQEVQDSNSVQFGGRKIKQLA